MAEAVKESLDNCQIRKEKMSEKKVKAVLVELTQNDCRKVVDGVETVQKGETRKYWYRDEDYAKEVLDYGKYWEADSESSLWLATPDGVTVIDYPDTLADWLELPDLSLEEALGLEPGQWIEVTFDNWNGSGCRVRMTAFAELPQLSAEQTVKASDLSNKAKARIRINGKPLYAPGTMEDGTRAWFPDLYDFAKNAIVAAVRAKGGPTAEVSLHDEYEITVQKGKTGFALDLKAKSREGLVEFLRNLGVPNPETVKVTKTVGDANGVSCVYTIFTGVDCIRN